jgi:hypothetical protein
VLPHVRLLAGEAAAGAVEAAAAGRLDQLYLLLQCAGQPMIYLMIFAMDPSSSEEAAQVVPPRAAAMAARASQFQPQCVLAWVAAVVDAANALIVARGELGVLCGLGWAVDEVGGGRCSLGCRGGLARKHSSAVCCSQQPQALQLTHVRPLACLPLPAAAAAAVLC